MRRKIIAWSCLCNIICNRPQKECSVTHALAEYEKALGAKETPIHSEDCNVTHFANVLLGAKLSEVFLLPQHGRLNPPEKVIMVIVLARLTAVLHHLVSLYGSRRVYKKFIDKIHIKDKYHQCCRLKATWGISAFR